MRQLTGFELALVSGSGDGRVYIDNYGDYIYPDHLEWGTFGSDITAGGHRIGSDLDWISVAGGIATGWSFRAEVYEGIGMVIEAGIIGAEYGSIAGPVGAVVGAGVALAATYAIHEYGPGVYRDIRTQLQ